MVDLVQHWDLTIRWGLKIRRHSDPMTEAWRDDWKVSYSLPCSADQMEEGLVRKMEVMRADQMEIDSVRPMESTRADQKVEGLDFHSASLMERCSVETTES